MEEKNLIAMTSIPRTRASIAHDLRQLGVVPGMIVIVHSSLSGLGWVSGGPVAVIQALMDVLTPAGTLVMPTQTAHYSDPAGWVAPPVPQSWWPILYEHMPAFDPLITPSSQMGVIAETFRTWPGVIRSNHPTVSFAAWGQHTHEITKDHPLEYALGEGSPLARMYDLNGWVLLLGVGYNRCTSLHLAEYRVPGAKEIVSGSPILEDGQRVWKACKDIELDSSIFPAIGLDFQETGLVKIGLLGSAITKLFPQRPAVDFAVEWLRCERAR